MPIDHAAIEEQLVALGEPSTWWEQRELRDLPVAMHADEAIRAIALAKLHRVAWFRRPWLIVVTNARLICLQTRRGMGRRQIDLQAREISDVAIRTRVLRATVIVRAFDATYRLRVRRGDAVKLVGALSQLQSPRERGLPAGNTPGLMVGRVIKHMLALPDAAVASVPSATPKPLPPSPAQSDDRMDRLEEQMHRLQQQMDFIEELLQKRSEAQPWVQSSHDASTAD
jgi:hypothetical protein